MTETDRMVIYLKNSRAIVETLTKSESVNLTIDKKIQAIEIKGKKANKKYDFVPWGDGNKLPMDIIEKAFKNVTVSANLDFNSKIAYGDGLMVVRKVKKDGKVTFEEVLDSEAPEIFTFLAENNYPRQIQEMANDYAVFFDSWVEFIISKETKGAKIVRLAHKEMCYSRVTIANKESGEIENHGYSANWSTENPPKDVVISPIVNRNTPILDIREKIANGEKRIMMSCSLPTPGRFYYNKPWWWSIFESGWYDFACAIPEFKRALLRNQIAVRFHVKIKNTFFEDLYKTENIIDEKEKTKRRKKVLDDLDEFLAGSENAGKAFISTFKYNAGSKENEFNFIIDPVKSEINGGEYIADSEEANNIICYAMGVHPSIIGASPGKNKSINGTEARELFIIKQAMTKPIRDMLLAPLYVTKEINGWPKDIHFVIPNIMLTTLDQGTGSVKSIGNQKI